MPYQAIMLKTAKALRGLSWQAFWRIILDDKNHIFCIERQFDIPFKSSLIVPQSIF